MALNNGWPYPLGTEPVRDGDNAIKAVADEAAKRLGTAGVQFGAIGGGVADANGALIVAFPKPFLALPAVTVTVFDSAVIAILYKPQLLAGSFTVLFKTLAGANRPGAIEFSWIAAGKLA
jgi:hypothetical protein